MLDEIRPLILPAVFFFWTVEGARQLYFWYRAGRKPAAPGCVDGGNPAVDADGASPLPDQRIRPWGLVWFFIGVIGLICQRPSVGWNSSAIGESDGSDAGLVSIIRKEVGDLGGEWRRASMNVVAVSGTNHGIVSFGRESLNGKESDAGTIYEIGSITKVFTGIAIASAVQRGLLEVKQPVADLLPEGFAVHPDFGDRLQLKHLAPHTAGFPRLPGSFFSGGDIFKVFLNGNPYSSYEAEHLRADLAGTKAEEGFGKKMEYSNYGVGLTGFLMSSIEGKSYEAMVRDRILNPLGISNTVVELDERTGSRFAQPYANVFNLGPLGLGLGSSSWTFTDALVGAGGIRSDAADMLKFLRANMNPEGTSISGSLKLAQEKHSDDGGHRSVGLFWVHNRGSDKKTGYIWHNGGTGGFRPFMGFTPDESMKLWS